MSNFKRRINHRIRLNSLCKVIFIILSFSCYFSCGSDLPQPSAKEGVLDAEKWDISNQNLELKGEWRFFWKQFLNPKEIDPEAKNYLRAGDDWASLRREGKKLPNFGYGTYRLDIKLTNKPEILSFYMPALQTAYRLYVDGELKYENGRLSENEDQHKPSFHAIIIPLCSHDKIIRIQLDVSNFTDKNPGIIEPIYLGKIENIYTHTTQSIILNWFIITILFILGGYNIVIFSLRKSDRVPFYLGFLYLGIVFMALTQTQDKILFNMVSDEWFLEILRLAKLSLPVIIYSGGVVLYRLYASRRYIHILNVVKVYSIIFILFCLFSPRPYLGEGSYYFELASIPFFVLGCFVSLLAVIQRKADSLLFLISFLIFGLGTFYENLHASNYLIELRSFGNYHLVLFLIPQIVLLTKSIVSIIKSDEKSSRSLMRSNEDLENKVKIRTSELEKANRWKANFVSLMSHDLRSPLNGVNQILEVMIFKFDSMPDLEKHRFLGLCKEGIQNSLRMLTSLLDVSRFDSDGIRLQQTKFSILNLLTEVIQVIKPIAAVKEIELDLNIDQDTFIIGDRALLGEVFKNILTNAIKYSYEKTSILIEERTKGDWVSVDVIDFGSGMDENIIRKIFGEKSPKSVPGTNGELGTGLGLKLCLNILEAHYSKLRIISELNKGSTFEVLFSRHTKTILLVDDSDAFRKSLAEGLRRNKWIVIEARNGEEALDHLTRIMPSGIVLDREMPVMDGISFIYEWEGRRGERKIPIILISSDAPLSGGKKFLQDEGLDEAVSIYLSKLVPKKILVEKIASIVK